MGINLFVEGYPDPVVITIQLQQEIEDFRTLKDRLEGLNSIDNYLKKDWTVLAACAPKCSPNSARPRSAALRPAAQEPGCLDRGDRRQDFRAG